MITNPNVVAINVHTNPTTTYRIVQVPTHGACAGFTSLGIDGVDVYFNDDNGGLILLEQLIETAITARDGMAERLVLTSMLANGNDSGVPDAELESDEPAELPGDYTPVSSLAVGDQIKEHGNWYTVNAIKESDDHTYRYLILEGATTAIGPYMPESRVWARV